MVKIKGPRFRSAKINPDRKLGFNSNRELPYRNEGVVFRKLGVTFRKRGVSFGNRGVSNIELGKKEDPVYLNNEGVKYYNQGKYKTALKFFNRASAVAPQFKMAKDNRLLCIKMMRYKEAVAREQKDSVTSAAIKTVKSKPIVFDNYKYPKQQGNRSIQQPQKKRGKKSFSYTMYQQNHPDWLYNKKR